MISFSPSEDQQMMINLVKQFAAGEMRKIYRQCDEKGQIPAEIFNTVWEMGFQDTHGRETLNPKL